MISAGPIRSLFSFEVFLCVFSVSGPLEVHIAARRWVLFRWRAILAIQICICSTRFCEIRVVVNCRFELLIASVAVLVTFVLCVRCVFCVLFASSFCCRFVQL